MSDGLTGTMRLASPADFKVGMRKLAAGVNVIAVSDGTLREGLTATAVCSLSAEPPHLLICVNATAGAHGLIRRTGTFCLNVLSRDQLDVARRFAGMDGSGRDERFALGQWTTLTTGAPVLKDALANFDCIVARELDASTHTVFVGRVLDVHVEDRDSPLMFREGQFVDIMPRALA